MINPVTTLISFMEQFQNGVSGFRRFVEIMDEPTESEAEDAIELADVKGELSEIIHHEIQDEIRARFKVKIKKNVTEAIDV